MKSSSFSTIFTLVMTCSLYYLAEAYDPKWHYDWTGIRLEMRDSIEFIERHGIGSTCAGMGCRTSKSYYTRHWLFENLLDEELIHLKSYPSGSVKTLAYEGLLRRGHIDHFNLLREVIVDNEFVVGVPAGCRYAHFLLSDYLFEHYIPELCFRPPFKPLGNFVINLNPSQKSILREEYYMVHLNREWYSRQIRMRNQ